MAFYRWIDGKIVEVGKKEATSESLSPFVQDDTLKAPLRHPVTGRHYDSLSAYMRTNKRLGLEVVGNDLLSKKQDNKPERITDALVMDKIEKAESILSDPSKRRHYEERCLERLARREELIKDGR